MLELAHAAWLGFCRACRAARAAFLACLAVLCGATLLVWWACRPSLNGGVLAAVSIAEALVLAWAQGVIARLVLRHLMVGDDGGLQALRPGPAVLRVAGVLLLTQIMVAAPLGVIVAILMYLDHAIGELSTLLSVPLLAPLAVAGAAQALRFGLAAAPVSLGLSGPLADSRDITEGHVLFIAGAGLIALAPLLLGLVLALAATGAAMSLATALVWSVFWALWAGLQGGLTTCLYQRWQSVLRPDMRPSRNRARRLEPVLRGEPA